MLWRVLLLSLSACGALTAQIDEPHLCQSLLATVIPAVADGGTISGTANLTIPFDLPLDQPGVTDVSIELTEVSLSAPQDGGAWGVLESAVATVVNPAAASGTPGVVVVNDPLPTGVPQPNPLVLSTQSANLAPFLQSGALQVDLALRGELPDNAWSLSANICFHVRATVDYAEAGAASP